MGIYANDVQKLYIAYFNRPADPIGLAYWEEQITKNGGSAAAVANAFSASTEYKALFDGKSSAQIVETIFQNLFGRSAEPAALTYWGVRLENGTFNVGNIATSVLVGAQNDDKKVVDNKVVAATQFTTDLDTTAEILAYSGTAAATTARTWLATVGATEASLTAAKTALPTTISGITSSTVANGTTYTLTTANDTLTGTAGNDTFNADNNQFSAADVINGGAGTDTLNYTDAGTTGGNVPAALVSGVEIINVRNVNGTAAVAATTETATVTFSAIAAAKTITIGGLTYTSHATTETTTAAQLAAAFANGTTGAVGSGTITGTLTGWTTASAGSTSVKFTATTAGNVADLVDTGNGSGTSTTITQGTAAVASTGVADNVAAGNFVGATDINSYLSTNAVNVTGLATAQKVGQVGNGSVTNGALSFAYATPTDAATLNISGGTKGTAAISNTGAGATAFTINSTGAANTVGAVQLAAGATVKTLTVNADSNLTTGAVSNLATDAAVTVKGAASSVSFGSTALTAAKTIDASGLTGGLTATIDTVTTSFKGGAGNDVVTTAATTATDAVIDAGAGAADVLNIAATNDITTAAKGAQYKNFEVLRLNASQDVSLVSGINALQLNAMTSGVVSNISADQAAAVTVRGNQATALTLSLKDSSGTTDAVSLNLSNSAATAAAPAAVSVAALSIRGVEKLNVASNGGVTALGSANSLTFGATTAAPDQLTAINVTGASSLDLNLTNIVKAVTVDASGMTGQAALKVAGAVVKGSSVTGTANADEIATGTVAIDGAAGDYVTYNAGAGNDTISTTVAALNNTDNVKASIKIDGGAGTDTVRFVDTGGVSLVDANFQHITNVEAITHAVNGQTTTITTGGFFDTNFKASGATLNVGTTTTGAAVSVNASTFTGNLTVNAFNAGANATSVTTGTGADKVVLSQAGSGAVTVVTGAGNDVVDATLLTSSGTITVTLGAGDDSVVGLNVAATVRGGAGADTFAVGTAAAIQTIEIAAGDSLITSYDKVTGFNNNGTSNDVLKFFAVDGTTATNTVAAALTGWTVASGIATKASATLADFIAAVSTSGTAGALAFQSGTSTFVAYSDGLATTTGDSIVELVGVTGATSVGTATTAGVITIA